MAPKSKESLEQLAAAVRKWQKRLQEEKDEEGLQRMKQLEAYLGQQIEPFLDSLIDIEMIEPKKKTKPKNKESVEQLAAAVKKWEKTMQEDEEGMQKKKQLEMYLGQEIGPFMDALIDIEMEEPKKQSKSRYKPYQVHESCGRKMVQFLMCKECVALNEKIDSVYNDICKK